MNLKDIREAIFSQSDWAPTQSSDAITRVNDYINRAYAQISQEAPFLFFESQLGFATQADVTPDTAAVQDANPAAAADTVSRTPLDPWVLTRDLPTTQAGLVAWDTTGIWRGRMILVTDPSGVQHRRRIRDIWTDANVQYVSLYRPWNNLTDTLMDWRIYTEDYYLPDDVQQVTSLRLFQNNQTWPIEVLGQLEAEQLSLADTPSQIAQGTPRSAFRRPHKQIESPTLAPVLSLNGPWQGPEPAGEFEYCFTYCWGYRDDSFRDFGPENSYAAAQAAPSRREPLWESAPSPIASILANNESPGRIAIGLPDIDYIQGFGRGVAPFAVPANADRRYHHSGWRKRIYRRRKTVDAHAYGALSSQLDGAINQETPDAFYLFADVDGWNRQVFDDGSVLPDYHRRLREVSGYQALRMYPRPNTRFEVDVRCIRRPMPLKDDQDAPQIHPDALDLILYRAITSLYEAQGNIELADRALGRYQELLFTLTKRYGDLRYPEQLLMKKPARAGRVINTRRPWRRWYNLPSNS